MTTSSLACKPRWATQRSDRPTYGDAARVVAAELGRELMPWQCDVLDVALEFDPATGLLVYRNVVLTVPRQSGKTTLLLVLILLRALRWERQRIMFTAQTGSDARTKWHDDWLPELEHTSFRRHFVPRKTTGHEALVFDNGSIQGLLATTKKSGHGASLDLAILDEAFAHPDARLEQAVKPAMITRPQPQLWVVSTAGTPEDSPYLWSKVERGRMLVEAGMSSGSCYFEWSADEGADPADPATWWSCMPALGYTVTEETIAADFATMELNEFERAYLNRWKTMTGESVIPLSAWADCLDDRSNPEDPVCFAFDVSPDRSSSSIAVCGSRSDGLLHVETVSTGPGTDWVAPRMAELVAKWKPTVVLCDPGGPAGSLVPEMEKAGIEPVLIGAREHAQACGLFFDTVMQARLRHRDQAVLVTALDGAKKRPLGDAWAWSRKSSSVDISPLVASTLAVWAFSQHRPKPAKTRFFTLNDALPEEG